MQRFKVFISYSHADATWLKRIRKQLDVLRLENLIDVFDDRSIETGSDWAARLNDELSSARLALLLVSPDFLTSTFIRKTEIPYLLDRHEKDGLLLFPLLIADCPWQAVPWLAKLQMRMANGSALESASRANRNRLLADAAREVALFARSAPSRDATTDREVVVALDTSSLSNLDRSEALTFRVNLAVTPGSAALPDGGKWRFVLYLESVGPGIELASPPSYAAPASSGITNGAVTLPANSLPPGTYGAAVIAQYLDADGCPTHISSASNFGVLQVYG